MDIRETPAWKHGLSYRTSVGGNWKTKWFTSEAERSAFIDKMTGRKNFEPLTLWNPKPKS